MPNVPPDRLQSFAFFVPTERDYQDGARWFRCDAVVEPLAAERTSIDGTLKDVYAKPLPVSYRLCEARLGQPVACDQEHEIEYLASVLLETVNQFPTQKGDIQVTAACRGPLLTALGLTEERTDLVFGYLLPTQEAWDAGSKGATCVVGAADDSNLRGTLADIGPSVPLPEKASGTGLEPPRRRLDVVDGREALQLVEPVAGVDEAHRARPGAHDERLGAGAARLEADALQELAVGDAGGGEEAVVALDEVVGGEDGRRGRSRPRRPGRARRRCGATAGPGSRRPCT